MLQLPYFIKWKSSIIYRLEQLNVGQTRNNKQENKWRCIEAIFLKSPYETSTVCDRLSMYECNQAAVSVDYTHAECNSAVRDDKKLNDDV